MWYTLTIDSSGQAINDRCMTDTIIGKRVATKSSDSRNEYVKRTIHNNAVLIIDNIMSFWKTNYQMPVLCNLSIVNNKCLHLIVFYQVKWLPFYWSNSNKATSSRY